MYLELISFLVYGGDWGPLYINKLTFQSMDSIGTEKWSGLSDYFPVALWDPNEIAVLSEIGI